MRNNNSNGSLTYIQAHSPPSKKISQVNYDTRYHFLNSKLVLDKLSQHTNSQSTTHSDSKLKKQICSIHVQKQEQQKYQQPHQQNQLIKSSATGLKRTSDQTHKRAMSSLSIIEQDKQQFYSSSNIPFNHPINDRLNEKQSKQTPQFMQNIIRSNDHVKTTKDSEQAIKNEEIAKKIIAICSHQIASHPSNLKLYQKRMQSYLKIGSYQNAIADADFILQNQPDNITALCSRGNAFMKLHIIDTAIQNFEEVLRIDPDNVNAALMKASCLNIQGDYIKAIDQYEDALEKDYEKSSMLNLSFNAKRNYKINKNSSISNLHSKNGNQGINSGLYYYDRLEQEELQFAGILDCSSNIKNNIQSKYESQQNITTLNYKTGTIYHRNRSPNKVDNLNTMNSSPHEMPSKHQRYNSYSSQPSGIYTNSSSSTTSAQQQQSYKNQSQFLFRSQSDKTQMNFNNNDSNSDADEQANLYFTKGYLARQKGEFLKAIELYSLALQLKPDFLKAVLNRGFLFDKLDEQSKAYDDYTRAIQIDSKCAFAYFNRGISLDKLNHWEEAVSDFSQAIELDQTNSDFYLNRGNALQKLELHQQAIFDYTKCMDFQTSKLSSVLISRAMSFEKSNDLERAKNDYEKSLQLNTSEAYVCCSRLANIYERKKDIQTALSFYNKALELNPKSMYCLVKRAQLYSNDNLFELACQDITTAIEIQGNSNVNNQTPQYSSLLYLRAKNFYYLNRFIEAAEDLLSALTLSPNDRSILALLQNTMLQLGEYEDALQYVEAEIKLHGISKQSLYNRSFCNIKLFRFPEAQIDLEILLKAEPNNPKTKESLAFCLLNQKKSTEEIKEKSKELFGKPIHQEDTKEQQRRQFQLEKEGRKKIIKESNLTLMEQQQQLVGITTNQKPVSKIPILNLPISCKVNSIYA